MQRIIMSRGEVGCGGSREVGGGKESLWALCVRERKVCVFRC
jgi:hypothetical protein